MFKFNLRDTVRDTITDFQGVVVARTEWLNGCVRYVVQSPALKDGKIVEGESLDEGQLILVEPAKPATEEEERKGGPFPAVKNMKRVH